MFEAAFLWASAGDYLEVILAVKTCTMKSPYTSDAQRKKLSSIQAGGSAVFGLCCQKDARLHKRRSSDRNMPKIHMYYFSTDRQTVSELMTVCISLHCKSG